MNHPFHTQEAFAKRLHDRRTNPKPLTKVAAFFHIALMPGWEPILREQFRLLANVGLSSPKAYILGSAVDIDRCLRMATACGVDIEVLGTDPSFQPCEGPTLTALHRWARENTDGAVIYLHSKGVSTPSDYHKCHWRRVMMKYVVAYWRHNLKLLEYSDMVGCGWQADPHFPHYCGNFWMARCEWIASLLSPEEHRMSRPDFMWAGHTSWRSRFYCETWIGSNGYHHPYAYFGVNARMWTADVFNMDAGIEGFDYNEPAKFVDEVKKGLIAVTHPGKIGDALYALPIVKWLCDRHEGKADFYTANQFAAMGTLVGNQPYINEFKTVHLPCRDPNTDGQFRFADMPVSGEYAAVYHLGFRGNPTCFLRDFIANSAGVPIDLPIQYEVPACDQRGQYVVVAPQPGSPFQETLLDFMHKCPYPVVEVGKESFLDMASKIAVCRWFVGTLSAPLVVANGFPCVRIGLHDGRTWDMRHVLQSGRNHYPVNPSADDLIRLIENT